MVHYFNQGGAFMWPILILLIIYAEVFGYR